MASAGRLRRARRRGRRVTAALLGPVVAAGASLMPVAMTATVAAGVTAAAVATAVSAKASTGLPVLVVLVDGESSAPEAALLTSAGYSVTQDSVAALESMSQSTFQEFAAVVIGDPSSGGSCPTSWAPTTSALGTNWESWVTGNVAVLGTAPELAASLASSGNTAADTLITDTAGYAAAQSGSGVTKTGLYLSLDCAYSTAAKGTAVPVLNGVEGIGAAGGVSVNGSLACADSGTVNTWEADAAGTFGGFPSGSLAAGSPGWPSPGCPVQEAFDSWPAMFTPVGYDTASDATANFTASDGVAGQPYILLGAPVSAATQALAPSAGGEVPSGATGGAAGNPAAPGVSQAAAGDPVDTEDGDFTQSATDLSVPTFGPALDFSRIYDAQAARQETVAGTPGRMGYGWTDNWATSVTAARPVPGNIYRVLNTLQSFAQPEDVAFDARGDILIADMNDNRVEEIAAYSHTQFGTAMTAGDAYTVAGSFGGASGDSGDGRPATSALMNEVTGVAVDSAGNLYIADQGNNQVRFVPAATGMHWGNPMTANDIYTIAGSTTGAAGDSGDKDAASSALLDSPQVVRLDKAGDLYIADAGNSRIQEIAAATGIQRGVSMTVNDIYTVAGSATGAAGDSGDGGAATSALLNFVNGLAVDSSGDLYVSDSWDNVIREVAGAAGTQRGKSMTANDIYTVAGNVAYAGNDTFEQVGDGGPATAAALGMPAGLATDAAGDLFIADTGNNRIQEVPAASGTQWSQSMTSGDMYTVLGSAGGTFGNSGNGGPAASALIDNPYAVAVDPSGNVYIPDTDNNQIREVFATTSQLFGLSPAGTGITVDQADGSQVTFYPENGSGACTAPYVAASGSGYCTLPQDTAAGLTYSSSAGTYTYAPTPGTSYVYSSSTGALKSESDAAGNTLTITTGSPSPGSGDCPSTASSCTTITAASGRALVLGLNSSSLVTSVTDPLGRRWAYAYNAADQLTSATDPMSNITSYTYGAGTTGNPQLASDLLTITAPNAQPGGPDAGDTTVNVYNPAGQVTSQTDPMGNETTFNYCVNAVGDCMNPATGTGLVTVTDPDGNQTVYDYDQGTLAAQSSWTKTTSGLTLTSENDTIPDTTAASTSNPSGGTLLDTSDIDGDGITTTSTYDSDGETTSATSPGPNGTPATTTTAYTASLQLDDCDGTAAAASTVTCSQDQGPSPVAPGGVITPPSPAPPVGLTYTLYDTDGNELYSTTGVYEPGATTAAYSQTTYQLFKGNSVTLPGTGTATSCTYTPPSASLPCATINADGVVTQLEYDAQGDLELSSTPDGNAGGELATTSYTYNADGEQLTKVAPDGNVTNANAGNYTTTTGYNADGEQTSVMQGGGAGYTDTPRTTSYTYDSDGNQVQVQDARGYTTNTAFNADDKAAVVTNPDGDATLTCYDGDGNVAQTVPAVGVAADSLTPASCPTSYPADYNPQTKPPLASDATMYTYDDNGDKTAAYTPAPAGQPGYETTTYTYDDAGNLIETAAPPPSSGSSGGSDDITYDTYNQAGNLTSEITGYGTSTAATTAYCYDPDGDKTAVVYGDGNAGGTVDCETSYPWTVNATEHPTQADYQTTYAYDSAGDLVSTTTPDTAAAPDGATTTNTYDDAGNELTTTDPDGVTTTYTYTPAGQTATVSYSGSSAHEVTYSYDPDGSKIAMTDATGTSRYTYDPFGELTSTTNGNSATVSYAYDVDGDTTGITYPLPSTATWATTHTVTYGYDEADQMTSATDFTGNKIAITDNADVNTTSESLGSSGDTITTTYDSTGAVESITVANSSGTTLQSFTYADAPDGDILTETDSPSTAGTSKTYGYDSQDAVTSETTSSGTTSYGDDASGNLTGLPAGATGTYDDAGELISSTSSSGTVTDYTYNADGERTAESGGTTVTATWNGAGQLTSYQDGSGDMTSATYDGNALRASSTTASGGTQNYTWNTLTEVPQLLTDSTNAYIYGNGTTPAEQVNLSTGTITYLITDSLGSVRGSVNASGSLTGSVTYDAWGNPLESGGLTATTPFDYAGYYTDITGLDYLIDRYYDPVNGQFVSVDPLLGQTVQPFQYGDGNPVSLTDPSGQSVHEVPLKTFCAKNSCASAQLMCQSPQNWCSFNWGLHFKGNAARAWYPAGSLHWTLILTGWGFVVANYTYSHGEWGSYLFHGSWGAPKKSKQRGQFTCGVWPFTSTCHLGPKNLITLTFWDVSARLNGKRYVYASAWVWNS
jgi:RHS repeat-associated protein